MTTHPHVLPIDQYRTGDGRSPLRTALRPLAVAVPLWIVAVAVVGFAFVTASSAARQASEDVTIPRTVLGLPILEGFRTGPHFGVHVQWGLPVVLVILPALLSVVPFVVAALARRSR